MIKPWIFVMAVLATHVTVSVLAVAISTDPKSTGEVQLRGTATGAPKPRIDPPDVVR